MHRWKLAALGPRATLTLGTALYCTLAALPAQAAGLPVPCAAGTCAGGPSVWVTQGVATAVTNAAGTQLEVNQSTDKAVLNWAEFNVAAGNKVNFKQPGASSLALNKIFQGDPSRILGAITANGQIYLINQNGILFGKDSRVNVGALVASSLDLDPEAVSGGILNPGLLRQGKAAFQGDGRIFVVDANGQLMTGPDGAPIPVKVVVEEGARISSAPAGGGRVALLGQQVENAGQIDSPDGQVILAAGQKVYLQASESPALRGLLVEVDAGGTAWSKATGQIASNLGNVSMVGLAVNQDGRVSATTSVQSNGSVRLLARDSVSVVLDSALRPTLQTSKAGAVILGAGSRTEVGIDTATAAKTAVQDQAQPVSSVEVTGRQIGMQAGSLIRAPGGTVSLTALPNPGVTAPAGDAPLPDDPESRIRLAAGSLIDVAGSTADVDLARNLVAVELRTNELRDSPVQRDGALRGATVLVDSRVGTPLGDVSGATAAVPADVRERTSTGGTVSLVSRGDVVLDEGASIDVSGGAVNYRGGVLQTSRLITADGRIVDISKADPDTIYRGVSNPTVSVAYSKWGVVETRTAPGIGLYRPGYVEGRDAGTVQFAAPRLVINGDLFGGAQASEYQRTESTRPAGGRLIIGLPGGSGLVQPDYRAPSIHFSSSIVPVQVTPGQLLPESWTRLELPTRYLAAGGFTRTALYSNGVISLDDGTNLDLAAGSSLKLQGAVVDVGGSIRVPGGEIALKSVLVNPLASGAGTGRPGVIVGDNVALDVSGRWTNDLATAVGSGNVGRGPQDPVFITGGRIDLQVAALDGELSLGDGVRLRADGGAALDAGGGLRAGRGGSIGVQALGPRVALATGSDLELSAYGLGAGGSLTLGANRLVIAGNGPAFVAPQRADPAAGDDSFRVATGLFQSGGFTSFNLVASGGRTTSPAGEIVEPLVVADGARIAPRVSLLVLPTDFRTIGGGADLRQFSSPYVPTDDQRPAASVAFTLAPHNQITAETAGDLLLAAGSEIRLDAGGRVDFSGPTRIRLDGVVTAPGGTISATLLSPPGFLDRGFDPDVGIFVGSTGRLDARGSTVLAPNELGLRRGEVFDGGTIALEARRGRVELAAGSMLDVSGTAADLDLPGNVPVNSPTRVASRGGSIDLVAPEGLRLDGTLRGPGGISTAEGGSLSLGISRLRGFNVANELLASFPAGPRRLEVTSGPTGDSGNGTAVFDTGIVTAGGFDSLVLQADDEILFASDVTLGVRNRLALQAPNLRAAVGVAEVLLSGNSLALGPRLAASPAPAAAAAGPARLRGEAGLIDLFGRVALQDFGGTTLESRTDIRATGLPVSAGTSLPGALTAAGTLDLRAAQMYPTTFSDYRVAVLGTAGSPGVLTIAGNGIIPPSPLSAAGQLHFGADRILQSGVVRAPLGQIEFIATDSLSLAAGSVTSTSGEGQRLPFGRVVGGTSWTYESVPGVTPDITAPPEKRVRLEGREILVADGALVDLAGGGDLYAYEFLPGPGGSVDALAPGVRPNLYAVVPGRGAFAPYDTQEYQGSGLQPGDSVRLPGVPGLLVAGEYALLPARYALLPGAVLVEVLPSVRDLAPNQVVGLRDGTPVVAGVYSIAGTTIVDSRTTGFALRPGSYARQLAEYRDNLGNDFFTLKAASADRAVPAVARDGGALQLVVGDSLRLGGTARLDPDLGNPATDRDNGRGGRLDLSAARLRIVDTLSTVADDIVEVAASVLNRIGAESVLLGGTRTVAGDRTDILPAARTVEVAPGLALAGDEYLLVAEQLVTIGDVASLRSTGSPTNLRGGEVVISGSSGSAFVRVSRNGPVQLERTASAVPSGDVLVGNGAILGAGGSITVDAGGTGQSFGTYDLGPGTALALGAQRIVMGADQSSVTDGFGLDAAALMALGSAAELQLTARQVLEVAGPVILGTDGRRPARLTLDSPVIRSTNGSAFITAGEITLRNSGVTPAGAPTAGPAMLSLTADRAVFGGGDLLLDGFTTATVLARSGTTGVGESRLRSGADLLLSTPSLSGAAGSLLEILAAGRAVDLLTPAGSAPATTAAPVGAALAIDAGRIVADTALVYPAGRVRLAADEGVELGATGRIDVAGRHLTLGGSAVDVAGGEAQLIGRAGDVVTLAGSGIDVSSGSGVAGAGILSILSGGQARLDGDLSGRGAVADSSGSLILTAGTLAGFTALNERLNAGGFSGTRSIETLSGDLLVEAGTTLRAGQVTLAASGGSLTVAGAIDARSAAGGSVLLVARDDLSLEAGGEIDARATGANAPGGRVTLRGTDGAVTLASGSRIRLDAAAGGTGGELRIAAAAVGADDMRIASFGAAIEGAVRTILSPVLRPDDALETIDATVIQSLRSLLDAFMSVAPASLRARLGVGAEVLVRPGLEVVADSDLVLADSWDLATWRWDDQPGYLALRATGDLSVLGSLSDGFRQTGNVLGQLAGDSWSLDLVAGADPASALATAVTGRLLDAPGTGTLELGDGLLVRTGTGDIRLVAARDLFLAGPTTAIYTAGVAARQAVNIGTFRANWSRDGGDILLAAGRDVSAILPTQVLSGWNVRTTGSGGRAQWATDYARFRQGVAALAGGAVDVRAGRDILNLSATVATTSGDVPTVPGTFDTWGGGSLDVAAGRDLLGGTYSIWQGNGRLAAGGSVGLGTTADLSEIGVTLAAGAGRLAVAARKDLDVGGILNPTAVPSANPSSVYFYTYLPDDALELTAVGGRLRVLNDLDAFALNVGGDFASLITAFGVTAPTFRAHAASGDFELVRELRLLPSTVGQAEIIAAGSILAGDRSVPLLMSDTDPAVLPTAQRPVGAGELLAAVSLPSDAVIHAGDDLPALLIAATGDILGGAWQFAKQFRASAAGDIRDLSITGQNTGSRQSSIIQAGRDIDLNARDNPRNSSGNRLELGGPGRLQVIAGRNVSLGFSRGITTVGNTGNARLPTGGAALDVWVGLGSNPDYAGFNGRYWGQQFSEEFDRYLAGPAGGDGLIAYVAAATNRTDLTADNVWSAFAALAKPRRESYLATLAPDQRITFASFVGLVDSLVAYVNTSTGGADLAPSTAIVNYALLPTDEQRPLIEEFFFRELRDSGRLANLPQGNFGFTRGEAAVDSLFPADQAYSGDLSLLFSRLYTLNGGDINVLAPGGLLNVGLAQPPSNLPVTKRPSDLGIVAQGKGRVRVFSDGDVLVNQSRIFTLAGGDILIWSTNGDIDAGRGSKSSISAPPPVIRTDANGQVQVEFSDAIAGSGIRGILTSEDIEPGDVDLIAPTGVVNAGDAGIGAAGNLNIAAPQVVGLDNIQVGGVAAGVPTDTGAAAGLTGVSSLSSSVASAAESATAAGVAGDQNASLADQALGWLEVFIEGFGDGTDEDDDERRRQRGP